MKIVLQRVKEASVWVAERETAAIERGVCLLVGIETGDEEEKAMYLAHKISGLRIFSDEKGRMNRSLLDIAGSALAVSQFTLAGSVNKGRRPSFDRAEEPARAEKLFDYLVESLRKRGVEVKTGEFGALMDVRILNDGPVTFVMEK